MKIQLKSPNDFKKLLLKTGFSQTKLANKAQISLPYLNQIINGDRSPSAEVSKKICDAVNKPFDDIFFIQDANKCEQI